MTPQEIAEAARLVLARSGKGPVADPAVLSKVAALIVGGGEPRDRKSSG